MKKIYISLFFIFVFSSCMTVKNTTYDTKITDPSQGFIQDEKIKFEVMGMPKCNMIKYKISNLTDKNIYINWNRASLIVEGEAFRVYDGEMKGVDFNKEQLSMLIPPKAFVNSSLVSGRNLEYITNNGWLANCFFEGDKNIGKSIVIRFPLIQEEITKEYIFKYEITDVVHTKKRENIMLH